VACAARGLHEGAGRALGVCTAGRRGDELLGRKLDGGGSSGERGGQGGGGSGRALIVYLV
jgi:hypothetical protein